MIKVTETSLPGVLILEPKRFEDSRGFFSEIWNQRTLIRAGIELEFVQDNQSLSLAPCTVRGLHCQKPPTAQAKLVRCGRGRLWDVAVDIRRGSPTFGQWVGVELSAQNGRQLLIPAGFLHGFVTREPNTEILYKCSDYYSASDEMSVRFDDPDLGIDWGIDPKSALLSQKDAEAPLLSQFQSPFVYED